MRASLIVVLLLLGALPAFAQTGLRVRVLDAHERTPLPGATVRLAGTPFGATAGPEGLAMLTDVPPGAYTLSVTYVGYREATEAVTLPRTDTSALVVLLEEDEEALEEVVVSTTRTSRTIADTPTRVEVIGEEEIGEKVNMEPSNISMMLNESPGITVQQTSAVSGSATFRIQGLEGRYTQLLRDGFPLYGGFSGSLSLLQVPPLDLAAVEVIKGPASTLYGGDAIAGIVNLVTKRPTEEGERSLLLNATTAGGLDAAGYYAKRGARTGVTALVSANLQQAYDAEDDAFTNLPETRRLTVSPTFFRYGAGTLEAGITASAEAREGGDVRAVRGDAPGYTERNVSERFTTRLGYERPLGRGATLRLRTSGSTFHRSVTVPGSRFEGRQMASYADASTLLRRGRHSAVAGFDLRNDAFEHDEAASPGARSLDHAHGALGAFVQDTWDFSPTLALESGLRVDRLGDLGGPFRDRPTWFVLPRAFVLVRPRANVALRVGGGLGYKAPTVFLEEAEARAFEGVRPLSDDLKAERSAGANFDVNVRRLLGPVALTFNQAFFVTRLQHALALSPQPDGTTSIINAAGRTHTRGSETTARLSVEPLTLFLGYVYLDAHRDRAGTPAPVPLTPAHRTYTVLVWEQHGRFRLGVEAYYTGPQDLTGGGRSPGFLVAGVMGERRFGRVRAFLNFENVLDARQSRTMPLVTGPRTNPTFPDIWGPTDGFIANGGVKVDF
ncbi:MAG TPA: TonB-dependent receptor [Rhodothermales bacterium]|nr:TonB-dependent receptor [Rhodothermales bacterium]